MSPKGKVSAKEKIVDAALRLAAERGWGNVGLRDIATRADLPFAEVYEVAPSRHAVEEAFRRHIDKEMLAKLEDLDPTQIARDRIFDVIMQRFEALEPYREGTRAIFNEMAKDPIAILQSRSSIVRSMAAILEASGIDSGGLKGGVRAHLLALIWVRTFQVWLNDDADLSKTMAQLDRRLRSAESYAQIFERSFGPENLNVHTAK